jgi:hypothetical protein
MVDAEFAVQYLVLSQSAPAHPELVRQRGQHRPAAARRGTRACCPLALPHHGQAADLARWWERQNDPLLADLIAAAQAASPDLAQARSRLAQARAAQVSAGAALLPSLDAKASASRGFNEQLGALASTAQAGLQASWELDLFGGNAAAKRRGARTPGRRRGPVARSPGVGGCRGGLASHRLARLRAAAAHRESRRALTRRNGAPVTRKRKGRVHRTRHASAGQRQLF